MLLKVGDKVRIVEYVCISNGELRPGHIGTVTAIDYSPCSKKRDKLVCPAHGRGCVGELERVAVKLDQHLSCLDEWDNHVHFDLGNWQEEISCEALVMRVLEFVPSHSKGEHPLVTAAREKWRDFLTEKLNETYAAWRREASRDFDNTELDAIARMVHQNYMEE